MKILHVLDHHHRYNGMVHAAVDLACAQSKLGHTVGVCSSVGDFAETFRQYNVTFFPINGLEKKLGLPSATMGLFDAVRAFKPEAIHAHMTKSAVLAAIVAKITGVPLITCVQNSFSKYAHLMKVGARVITGCKAVASDMRGRGIPEKKLRPILNGTIHSVRQPSDDMEAHIEFKHPAIVTFCGMHWRKGVPDLIEGVRIARQSFPDLHLYLFGEGPDLPAFKALVPEAEADHFIFCDPVPNAKPYLMKADVFVLASVADPAPLVISEAREAGLAVIGTRVDGIPELLEDGRAGLLVEPRSPDQIADKLIYLFSNPKNLATWRANSQINISRLTVERVAEQTVQVYSELVRTA